MINSKTTGTALLFAVLSLGSIIAIPGLSLVPTTTAYAQTSLAEDLVGGVLDDFFGDDGGEEDNGAEENEEEEETADNTQTVEQPVTQDVNQEVDQSEENDQSNTNTQTQTGVIDQDTEQGIQDGDDSAESNSESGDAKAKKYGTASSSSSSGDAASVNNQDAANDASLQQVQVQNVHQDNFAEFGDEIADLAAVNVGIPIAVPINVQEELEEEEVVDEEPPVEDETFLVCIDGQLEIELTQEQIDAFEEEFGEDVLTLGECEEIAPL